MPDNHILPKQIGNLRGFSTDSIFMRPSNVADLAINLNMLPDKTTGPRRGYQCQVANIGGFGTSTYDNDKTGNPDTITLNSDGILYKKLERQIFLFYQGAISMGDISAITQAASAQITTSSPHGLINGASVLMTGIDGMIDPGTGMSGINGKVFVVTVTGANTFTIPLNTTTFSAYSSGGTVYAYYSTNRYLTFSIFTSSAYAINGGSITCQIIVNFASQVNGAQTNVTTMNVAYPNQLAAPQIIQFLDVNGVLQTRTITGVTSTSITFAGAVSVANGTIINQVVTIPFGKGFDVTGTSTIVTLNDFLTALVATGTDTLITGIAASWNGTGVAPPNSQPAAFLALIEPTVINSGDVFTLNYYYWNQCNKTVPVSFPGTANPLYQNSKDYENAAFASFNDVLYVSNGWDYPQKYDGQTVYRTGMPQPPAPTSINDNPSAPIKPFLSGEHYIYSITYEQVDNIGHIVEGIASNNVLHTVGSTCAIDVEVPNIISGSGWNTNCAIASGGFATVYGPDNNGFYYDIIPTTSSTLNIGDTAFYNDLACAVVDGTQTNVVTIAVQTGHGVLADDELIFVTSSGVLVSYQALSVTAASITLKALQNNIYDYVSVTDTTEISVNKESKVFGDVAIVDGQQDLGGFAPSVNVVAGHTLQMGDTISFVDINGDALIALVAATSPTSITLGSTSANPFITFTLADRALMAADTQTTNQIIVQRPNSAAAKLGTDAPISNNLRINIYRSKNNGTELFRFGVIPNNSFLNNQTFTDELADDQFGIQLGVNNLPGVQDSPPISKYVLAFGNQMIYAGGDRNGENNDNIYFSLGTQPENVPPATNFEYIPSTDDEITGVGVAGTTLCVTKNRGIWAFSGDLVSGQYTVNPISPGSNIGCVSFASMQSIGSLLYFAHTNGVYTVTENQFFPTDAFGTPVPISLTIDVIFRRTNYFPQNQYQLKRSVGVHYTKDNQYLLFLPCQDPGSSQNVANQNSIILCYDTMGKNWYQWTNINAAGGMFTVGDDLYFHERRYSGVVGNTANLYKQHRKYRLIDYADHTQPIDVQWRSSWEDLGQPEVRKKFSHCMLLMDRISSLDQFNRPILLFSTYLDRIPDVQDTIATITTVDNNNNAFWSNSPWGWGVWSGYQDSFIRINLRRGTVAKSIQVGFSIKALNTSFRLAGFQLESIPEFRKTFVR